MKGNHGGEKGTAVPLQKEREKIMDQFLIASESAGGKISPENKDVFTRIFLLLRNVRGVDFSGYKYTTVSRRITRRMILHRKDTINNYLSYLLENPAELEALYRDLLITVTEFFRDPEAFQLLKSEVLPVLTNNRAADLPIRIWVPGCSTGEEVYSLGICFLEFFEETGKAFPIHIFGSDVHEETIEKARSGMYQLEGPDNNLSPERLDRFFTRGEHGYQVTKPVREICSFARHDVTEDPPLSNLDLISCRNVLIYMESPLQRKILSFFHYALKPDGFLMLGPSESVEAFPDLFRRVHKKQKMYVKKPTAKPLLIDFGTHGPLRNNTAADDSPASGDEIDLQEEIHSGSSGGDEVGLQKGIHGSQAGGDGSDLQKEIHGSQAGGDEIDLQKKGKTGRRKGKGGRIKGDYEDHPANLKQEIDNGNHEGHPDSLKQEIDNGNHEGHPDSLRQELDTGDHESHPTGLRQEIDNGNHEGHPDSLRQELDTTRKYLKSIIEEKERTNEELRVANEEIRSGNEELQSLNEELQAAHEELQSTNEKLLTLNEEMESRNSELDQIFNTAADGMRVVDKHFTVLRVNQTLLNLVGLSKDEMVGKKCYGTFPGSLCHTAGCPLMKILGGQERVACDAEKERTDGTKIPCMVTATPFRSGEGELLGIVEDFRDITERKKAEREQAQHAEELARSNADLQQFAYVASHDLQEPLRMVASYVQLLARRYKGKIDADADDFIAYAVDGALRMQGLINDLLAYSRVGTQGKSFKPTDCTEAVNQAMANLQVAAAESQAVITHDLLPTVMADSLQMVQLFQNLIGNALKFHGQEPPRIHISAVPAENEWVFSVQDNGIGIDPEYAERIFIIFQRLHNKTEYPGTGIGLAVCKRIVERHRGRIWVESTPGAGARFFFTIPRDPIQRTYHEETTK